MQRLRSDSFDNFIAIRSKKSTKPLFFMRPKLFKDEDLSEVDVSEGESV